MHVKNTADVLVPSQADGNQLSQWQCQKWTVPPSDWQPLNHPRAKEVAGEVDAYFLQHWNFPDAKAEKTFINAGFSDVTCLYFPLAKDDRIHFACRLLTVLFLIDDLLEDMSFAEGEAYNEKLIPISRGHVLPDRKRPRERLRFKSGLSTPQAYILLNRLRPCRVHHLRPLGKHART